MIDEEAPKPKREFVLGQPLDALSVEELAETIEHLRQEIERLESARKSKVVAIDAAQALFRRK